MDDRVDDMVSRIVAESPGDPLAVAKERCQGDPELLAAVMAALQSHQMTVDLPKKLDDDHPSRSSGPDEPTVMPSRAQTESRPQPQSKRGNPWDSDRPDSSSGIRRPDLIGHFQIESEVPIGRGGFGEVWEAFRVEGGFRQRVAVKIISRGNVDENSIRRFELERQVLASLDHPDIARLIDGGEMEDGRPWLAMEYVDGVSVTKYCDRTRLSIDERVRLFMKIAMAVQHAHENLVVHRDIKPENILVTAKGDPKLLDFGIAKLVNPDLSGEGVKVTQIGEGVLTPDYAAPEQFTGETVGTRADVYSLGVLFYELLTGRLPFFDEERGYVNIRTAKLEKEPTRPSHAVSTNSIDPETARRISTARDSGLNRIRRQLDGDLDVIILKALRREPSRRYSSPRDLVADLQRHLDGLPVEARPDSIGYRTTRFVARHRAGFAVSATAIVALALGACTVALFAEARSARALAETERARSDAETARADSSEMIRDALAGIELISASKGTETMVGSLVEANRLDDAEMISVIMLQRLETALEVAPGNPDLLARKLALDLLRASLRDQRRNPSLGDVADAARRRKLVRSELETALSDEPGHPELLYLAAMIDLEDADAIRLRSGSDPALVEAKRETLNNALTRLEEAEIASGSEFPRQRAMIGTALGDVLRKSGEPSAALDAYQVSRSSHEERGREAVRDLAILETRMAYVHATLGEDDRAIDLHRRSLAKREDLAESSASIESSRARRDLATGHLYLSEALQASSPASAKRHLERYLELTFEVAWLDPLDHRGGVSDLQKAMGRASRLNSLSDGDIEPFTSMITRFRDTIITPRLKTLPGADSARLAVRADRYLAEAEMHFADLAEEQGLGAETIGHRVEARRHLDAAIENGRALIQIDRSQPEILAEVGLCLAYRIGIEPLPSERIPDWIEEALEIQALAREAGGTGPILRKFDAQMSRVSSDAGGAD